MHCEQIHGRANGADVGMLLAVRLHTGLNALMARPQCKPSPIYVKGSTAIEKQTDENKRRDTLLPSLGINDLH